MNYLHPSTLTIVAHLLSGEKGMEVDTQKVVKGDVKLAIQFSILNLNNKT